MLAGGLGAIRPDLALKNTKITPGSKLIVLGGQSMLIGLGGGAASSISSGEGSAELDFASVQRGNPEIQRRAQQVIDACVSFGAEKNPIQFIHDVGAGGLSNALPELVHDNDLGAKFELRSILSLEPAVGSKNFLITIGDRFVTGLVDRDQMVGPWQTPVADVGVTATSLGETVLSTGEALSMGEKPTLALISASASAKIVKLSANWMSAASHDGEGAKLYEAVQAIGLDLCPDLGVSIPVGKDSMSMKMKWDDKEVTAPLSLTITAFAPVDNTSNTWTPQIVRKDDTQLVYVDLAADVKKSLGGSALAQVYKQVGNLAPTVHSNKLLKSFLESLVVLHKKLNVLAYHDVSEGGLLTTVLEMAFAGRTGVKLDLKGDDLLTSLFNEELGAVFQINSSDLASFNEILNTNGVDSKYIQVIVYENTRDVLQQLWANTSYQIQRLRDNPKTTDEEYESIKDNKDPGLSYQLTYSVSDDLGIDTKSSNKPKVAILREQGVNSQQEMAWCFSQAGFEAYDVHMSDILSGKVSLDKFVGIAACGGFSYGDVLGAGAGWAKSVLFNERARNEFIKFFQERQDTFAFGACNGCQFLSRISELIPGTESWPSFERNVSEQYEARFVMVEVDSTQSNNSIFLDGMKGSKLPIVVAHGEGRASFQDSNLDDFISKGQDVIKYVDNYGDIATTYPYLPNGSTNSIAGISSENGRVLAMMPHPERVCRKESNSWYPKEQAEEWGPYGPWIRLFRNARKWVGDKY
ncbi:hypothetical protein QCA50_009345 [Cerrena zonata]|uniref:Phosphoribosylformylglycinamidine synthase n=1 Tax=Cerrena zonata TaxID=2478898 RepID=A0AAW0GBE6_9APHY